MAASASPLTSTVFSLVALTNNSVSSLNASANSTLPSSTLSSTDNAASNAASPTDTNGIGGGQGQNGITLLGFLTALAAGLILFAIQMTAFFLLRLKLRRIFQPKTYLVPRHERTKKPPHSPWGMVLAIMKYPDRELMKKCGLDAYFFLRYLYTLLVIFIPIAVVVIPILTPINYIAGYGQDVVSVNTSAPSGDDDSTANSSHVTGLDTLAWGNIRPENNQRRWAHLLLALCVIFWVCTVFCLELRVYVKVRQDYLTSGEHRLRASASTVLINSIPKDWLTQEALKGLFDIFPGGIKHIWLNRDFTKLLDKISLRDDILRLLEQAESEMIRKIQKKYLRQEIKIAKKAGVHPDKGKKKHNRHGDDSSGEDDDDDDDDDDDGNLENVNNSEDAADLLDSGERPPGGTNFAIREDSVCETSSLEASQGHSQGHKDVPHSGSVRTKCLSSGVCTCLCHADGQRCADSPGCPCVCHGVDLESDDGLETTPSHKLRHSISVPLFPAASGERPNIRRASTATGHLAVPSNNGAAPTHPASSPSPTHVPSYERRERRPRQSLKNPQPSGTRFNTTRKPGKPEDMFDNTPVPWYKFWKPPPGGFVDPKPQSAEDLTSRANSEKEALLPAPKSYSDKKPVKVKTWWRLKFWFLDFFEDQEEHQYERATSRDWEREIRDEVPNTPTSDASPAKGPEGGRGKAVKWEAGLHRALREELQRDELQDAAWRKYLEPKDRPRHFVPWFQWTPLWLPGIPGLHKKVDTIYWCRAELARLNVEIREDQEHTDRYPYMNSAFIQFHQQAAAHMVCQSIVHHLPKKMAPRAVEISPNDIIWENMARTWWDEWLSKSLVGAICLLMTVMWAVPVAWSASLSQIDAIINVAPWLGFLKDNATVFRLASAIAGVLPAAFLAILLIFVPMILHWLARLQGSKTGAQRSEFVQATFFPFLFVQVFLVVSITSSAWQTISNLENISSTISNTPDILAQNLPKAANYFFTYMILQALSTSSGNLAQVPSLLIWFVWNKMTSSTVRDKWRDAITLPTVEWGSLFPIYTNFACIALIYSVIAPLISLFAIITFSLLWFAHRYNMLYVNRFRNDTGGVLYPRAINQTFTGLYVMELCLIGLFFLVRDEQGEQAAIPQAVIMIVALVLTALFQYLVNRSLGPLFRYLPITLEDEAELRDVDFQSAWDKRVLRAVDQLQPSKGGRGRSQTNALDRVQLAQAFRALEHKKDALKHGRGRGSDIEAEAGADQRAGAAAGLASGVAGVAGGVVGGDGGGVVADAEITPVTGTSLRQRQHALAETFFSGVDDDLEDLAPKERDDLVKQAFCHAALRARPPTVWIPRDDLGVSADEILRAAEFSENVRFSDANTAMDEKARVVYTGRPPDFEKQDLIIL